MTDQPVRWTLGFLVHEGEGHCRERDFPAFTYWHPSREASEAEGVRVLRKLRDRGDERDWLAYGHPDPREVGAGRHPGSQWLRRLSDLT